jgi:arylsulfatase
MTAAAWGRGGKVTLKANGAKIAEGRLERSVPIQFAIFEGLDVGMDICSAVDFTYAVPFTFTGTVERVEIEVFPETPAKQKAAKAKSQEAMARQ